MAWSLFWIGDLLSYVHMYTHRSTNENFTSNVIETNPYETEDHIISNDNETVVIQLFGNVIKIN
jgi:hypothetical protein